MTTLTDLQQQERQLAEKEACVYEEARYVQQITQELDDQFQKSNRFLKDIHHQFFTNDREAVLAQKRAEFTFRAREAMNQLEETRTRLLRQKQAIQEEQELLTRERGRLIDEEKINGR